MYNTIGFEDWPRELEEFSEWLDYLCEKARPVRCDDDCGEALGFAMECVAMEIVWDHIKRYIEAVVKRGLAPPELPNEVELFEEGIEEIGGQHE